MTLTKTYVSKLMQCFFAKILSTDFWKTLYVYVDGNTLHLLSTNSPSRTTIGFVVLSDIGQAGNSLLTSHPHAYLGRSLHESQFVGPDEYFIHEHFLHCLHANIRGGHITDDYEDEELILTVSELGLFDPDQEVASSDHPLWHDKLGEEISRVYSLRLLGRYPLPGS